MALPAHLLAAIKGAKAKHGRSNNKIVKLKEGRTKVRILAPDDIFWQDLGIHWIKEELNGKPVAVVGCHDHTYDQPCPVCTAVDKALKSTKDDDTLKLYKEWGARKEIIVNAMLRSGPDASETDPVVLSLTPTTFTAILSIIEEYADEVGNILDPETGLDLIVERTGKGLDTKYSVMPAPKSVAVPKGVMDKCVDLKELVEKEFFGREAKALNAIAAVSGVTPSITHATRSMLTGPKPVIEDAEVEEIPTPKAKAKPAPVVEDEPPFEVEEKPAPKAKAETKAKPAAAPAPEDDDELSSILDSLDDL